MTAVFDRHVGPERRHDYAALVSSTNQQIFQLGIGIAGRWAAELRVTILPALYTLRTATRKVYEVLVMWLEDKAQDGRRLGKSPDTRILVQIKQLAAKKGQQDHYEVEGEYPDTALTVQAGLVLCNQCSPPQSDIPSEQ